MDFLIFLSIGEESKALIHRDSEAVETKLKDWFAGNVVLNEKNELNWDRSWKFLMHEARHKLEENLTRIQD